LIPPFEPETGNLPPGVHEATWAELAERYGYNERRQRLLVGLRAALESLKQAGCRRAFVDGSFVTAKDERADFDACWDVRGVVGSQLDPVLLDFRQSRRLQKMKFGGELFPAIWMANENGVRILDYFQVDPELDRPKGIVAIELEGSLG
jgi:hypothetical protein